MSIPISNEKLPSIAPYATWNSTAGLVVSPSYNTLPEAIADRAKPSKNRDWHLPRLLGDADIYLAFFPRHLPHSSLFAPLSLSPDELEASIVSLSGDQGYMLAAESMDAWIDIEDALISIIHTLMGTHPQRQFFPHITWPYWPEHTGYRDCHADKKKAFQCARYAKRAFIALSACTTFAISLWLNENEYLCFRRAWDALANRPKDPIPLPFIDMLQDSIICNLEAGFRPGGFINPYLTRWGRFMRYFVRARVPIWFIWGLGPEYKLQTCVESEMFDNYLPPTFIINGAKERYLIHTSVVLPTGSTNAIVDPTDQPFSRTGPPVYLPGTATSSNEPWNSNTGKHWSSQNDPIAPPAKDPRVEVGSGQRHRESWELFAGRATIAYTSRVVMETTQEQISRKSREEYAKKQGLSSTCRVFSWEQDFDDPTFYRRTYVSNDLAPSLFQEYYPHQRVYWGHTNEWDLVPTIPAPPGVTLPDRYEDDEYDEDFEGVSSLAPLYKLEPRDMGERMVHAMRKATEMNVADILEPPQIPTLQEYLLTRHGFTCSSRGSWNKKLHDSSRFALRITEAPKAAGILLFSSTTLEIPLLVAVADCVNTMSDPRVSYSDLTDMWDLRSCLKLDQDLVSLQKASMHGQTVYILRPPAQSADDSRWYVALSSPTAVLLVYRKGWAKMSEIARGLLGLGIPFRTVVEDTRRPPEYNWNQKSRGLGMRPRNYKFKKWDYDAYLKCQHTILTSSSGRAIRLRGGLIGRIAAEVVPDTQVIDGPALCDEVVAQSGDIYFLDDGVSDETLDRICGVYHVWVKDGGNCVIHESWWPKHDVFTKSGRFSDQWLEDSETFYRKKVQEFASGVFRTRSSSEWRADMKYKRTQNDRVIGGSEELAQQFLNENLS